MMNPIRTLSLTLFMTLTLVATSSWARDLDGQKGIGFAQAIGGPNGLAFNYGIGTLNLETIFGMSRFSTQNEDTDPQLMIATSAGLHFQLLSSENGAFCVGARFNLATGSTQVGVRDSGGALGLTETRDVTQVGFDIPEGLLVSDHISIHSEFYLAFWMGVRRCAPDIRSRWRCSASARGLGDHRLRTKRSAGTTRLDVLVVESAKISTW